MFEIKESNKTMFLQHMLLIVLFAFAYYFAHIYIKHIHNRRSLIHPDEHKHNDTLITFFDCLRFSLITQTTVGYGSLIPTHTITKYINFIQLMTIYGVIIISFV